MILFECKNRDKITTKSTGGSEMLQNNVESELIHLAEAAVILGIAKKTFYQRFRANEYDGDFCISPPKGALRN